MKKKAGMEMAVLVSLMILLVVSGLLFTFWYQSKKSLEGAAQLQICRNSFLTAQTIAKGSRGLFESSFTCPANHIVVNNNGLYDKVGAFPIVNAMKNCWYKTSGDKNNMGFIDNPFWDREINWCMVCDTFEVEQRLSNGALLGVLTEKNKKTGKTFLEENLKIPWVRTTIHDNQNFGIMTWAFWRTPLTAPYEPGHIAKIKEDQNSKELDVFLPDHKYYVMIINYGRKGDSIAMSDKVYGPGEYNHLFLIDEKDTGKIACDVFHYDPP